MFKFDEIRWSDHWWSDLKTVSRVVCTLKPIFIMHNLSLLLGDLLWIKRKAPVRFFLILTVTDTNAHDYSIEWTIIELHPLTVMRLSGVHNNYTGWWLRRVNYALLSNFYRRSVFLLLFSTYEPFFPGYNIAHSHLHCPFFAKLMEIQGPDEKA